MDPTLRPRLDGPKHSQLTLRMKTAILPQVRVEPQLRADLEAVLREGETLSDFLEASHRLRMDVPQPSARATAPMSRSAGVRSIPA
jgi:hypothetical protein